MREESRSGRLLSLDALRGFDMLWIIGGAELVHALAGETQGPFWLRVSGQLHHAEWHGFRAWDLIFPLFLFLAGVSMPYSFARRTEQGEGRWRMHWHVLRRGLLLVLLGIIYNGLLEMEGETMRYPSVLGRIGLAWMLAAFLVLRVKRDALFFWVLGILLGYWALLTLIPVPGAGAGDLSEAGNLAFYLDRALLPGRLHRGIGDPEGLLGTLPAVATALLGVLTGQFLRGPGSGHGKAGYLLLSGGACLALGSLWSLWFPLNKSLWTSSFVLVSGGLSLLLLCVFYVLFDLCRLRWIAWPLAVIGMNPLTIYLLQDKVIDFERMAGFFWGGLIRTVPRHEAVLFAAAVLVMKWLCLWLLYRKRVFLRV